MTMYGYARCSTEYPLESQVEALHAAGCTVICPETMAGAVRERPELNRAIMMLRSGDCLVVTRLDRLARSIRDLLNILAAIGHEGAHFKSLADTWADTTTPQGRLMITILASLAEFERAVTRTQLQAGMIAARQRGVRIGRPPIATAEVRLDIIARRRRGELMSAIATACGLKSHATVSRICAEAFYAEFHPRNIKYYENRS